MLSFLFVQISWPAIQVRFTLVKRGHSQLCKAVLSGHTGLLRPTTNNRNNGNLFWTCMPSMRRGPTSPVPSQSFSESNEGRERAGKQPRAKGTQTPPGRDSGRFPACQGLICLSVDETANLN